MITGNFEGKMLLENDDPCRFNLVQAWPLLDNGKAFTGCSGKRRRLSNYSVASNATGFIIRLENGRHLIGEALHFRRFTTNGDLVQLAVSAQTITIVRFPGFSSNRTIRLSINLEHVLFGKPGDKTCSWYQPDRSFLFRVLQQNILTLLILTLICHPSNPISTRTSNGIFEATTAHITPASRSRESFFKIGPKRILINIIPLPRGAQKYLGKVDFYEAVGSQEEC
jgi:hypothetical protein